MNELQIFENLELGKIRVLNFKNQYNNEEPWFVGKDIASILGYNEPNKAINRHVDEDDRTKYPITDNIGRIQESWLINESGLYSLVLSSKLPSSKKFKRWVTNEVLPAIRQTGGYIPVSKEESDEEILAKALLVAQKTLEKKDRLLKEKEEIIQLQQPKVEIYDMFVDKETTFGLRELRKELESTLGITIKETELKRIMRELGRISGNSVKKLLAKCIREGYGVTKDTFDIFENPITVDRFTMKAREELLKYF